VEKWPAERKRGARVGRARAAVTTCSSRMRRHGGTLNGSSVVVGWRQGAVGELTGATGRVPGNAVGDGAHPSSARGMEAVEDASSSGVQRW
jgi:hypothetical protein